MREYVSLIKGYAKSGTYFVRKISAQSLLPTMRFDEYVKEMHSCFTSLRESKLRQNEAHGLMIRINIFVHAYYRYQGIDHVISGRS